MTDSNHYLESGFTTFRHREYPAGLDEEILAKAVIMLDEWRIEPDPDSVDMALRLYSLFVPMIHKP